MELNRRNKNIMKKESNLVDNANLWLDERYDEQPSKIKLIKEVSNFLEGATEFKLNINMENDTFVENPSEEVARILRDLADRIKGHSNFSKGHSQPLRDINGNTVGGFDII
jgi:hypothetical protein